MEKVSAVYHNSLELPIRCVPKRAENNYERCFKSGWVLNIWNRRANLWLIERKTLLGTWNGEDVTCQSSPSIPWAVRSPAHIQLWISPGFVLTPEVTSLICDQRRATRNSFLQKGEQSTVLNLEGKEVGIIVAHNDDETVWMGATILANPDAIWRIYTLVGDRGDGLTAAIQEYRRYGVHEISGINLGFQDTEDPKILEQQARQLQKALVELKLQELEVIFTHNRDGEYGHEQHKMVHKVVCDAFVGKRIWQFICPGSVNVCPQPVPERAELHVQFFDPTLKEQKNRIFDKCYPSESYLWEILPEVMFYEFKTGPEIFANDLSVHE